MSGTDRKIAVLGDLHYEVQDRPQFLNARAQIQKHKPDAIFQLGDQGGYSHCGTWSSFLEGREFLEGFGFPFHTLIGNHDLEGPEYRSDAEAVTAWCRAFRVWSPYSAVDLGHTLAICLSSVRFRSNPNCPHEIYLDAGQIAWLSETLDHNRDRPTFVFSHAPILGSGIRVLQSVHLQCPNAWINHTQGPERLIAIVERNPQIKLWFSAHNHLGHSYPDSVSQKGACTFVHTGVIGPVSRDGCRQSRLVEFDESGLRLSTLDHLTEETRVDVRHDYASGRIERLSQPSAVDGALHFAPPPFPTGPERLQCGRSAFALHRGMLVEYDLSLQAPIGIVVAGLTDERITVHRQELCLIHTSGTRRVFRADPAGRYSKVFHPNPWLAEPLSA